jgi:hypothetical protein
VPAYALFCRLKYANKLVHSRNAVERMFVRAFGLHGGLKFYSPTTDATPPYFYWHHFKVLADYHRVSESAKHVNDWKLDGVQGLPKDGKLDLAKLGLPPLSMRVRVGRNLKEFSLPGAMTKADRVNLEAKMCVEKKTHSFCVSIRRIC